MALTVENSDNFFFKILSLQINFYINLKLNLVCLKIVMYYPKNEHDIYSQSSS